MNLQNLIDGFTRVVWAFFLVALPVTSFPFLPAELGGKTLVRPLAMYPLLILLFIVTLPRLFRKPLPVTFLPLFAFVVAALASSLFSLTLDIEAFKGVSVLARIARSLITLLIGIAYYLTVVLYNQKEVALRFSLRCLYIGFLILLSWSSLQVIYVIHYNESYFILLNKIQSFISTQELYPTRISGMTYEPKWFAEQITFLLMPFLIAAVISGKSVFRRYRWISVELILLLWSIAVLGFTFSRTGFLALILLTFASFLLYRIYHNPSALSRRPKSASLPKSHRRLRLLAEAGLVTAGVLILAVLIGSQNPYFSRLWRYWSDEQRRGKTYLEYIAFGQRFVYVETALRIFEQYPALGVGVGNYAFYFDDLLPQRSYTNLPEVIRQITPSERGSQLITPKNLFARLLAETGLLGMITFTAFIFAILGCSLYLLLNGGGKHPVHLDDRYWGMAGILSLVVFLTVAFSTDSFAIPNMWVVFGLITAAAHLPLRPGVTDLAIASPPVNSDSLQVSP